MKYVGEISLALGHRFTQVRPLLIRGKDLLPAFLYCFRSDLDYKVPAPLWGVGDYQTSVSGLLRT